MTDLTLADASVDLVQRWIDPANSKNQRTDPAAKRLAHLLKDPQGLDFTIGFVDRVIRPDDTLVAAHNLRALARHTPKFLPVHLRALVKLGAFFSLMMPGFVVATARRALRRMVGHLIIDARPKKLGKAIRKLRADGDRLNLNLLGEAVLGDDEAARRLAGTRVLLEREDVDYVSVKVSAVASQLSLWAFEETVDRVVDQLSPLYAYASSGDKKKFINLDMEEYRDLDLTIAVFTKVLDQFPDLEAGIVLQAYLPDALGAMERLQDWASERRINGGSPIKVRVVKGANLAMERVDALVHGWPQATFLTKQETDTNYKRVLNYAFTPERMDAVRIGVAGQNLFDVAYAWLLAGKRSVRGAVDFEMLLGMASGQAAAVRKEVGELLLYTPVVHPDEFDVAISYLVRRLEENASQENFMSAVFELSSSTELFEREKHRFLDSVKAIDDEVPAPHRVQDRYTEGVRNIHGDFANTPDTDPSVPANRAWGRSVLSRSTYTQMGNETVKAGRIPGPASLESMIQRTQRAGAVWGKRDADIRSWVLHQCATSLAARRGELISVMAAETGKTIAEADVEVSEAIDFANYYAEAARRLEAVDGATFNPAQLTVVTPPWNFPVAIPAGSVLAALASGSGVIIKPAHQARRCSAVMVEALWEAGVPRDVLSYATIDEGVLGKALISHSLVDRVILTGAWETAALFRSWRTDLPLLAETSGKNAIIVTPSADIDQAAADVAKSAFGHAGQKCSAASLVILVGSVATSERFHRQLVDAVTSQRVGYPDDPEVFMGPIIEPAAGKLAKALTTLAEGEEWLIEPRQLDATGRLWSPGVRTGVVSGSYFHTTEFFGPVLGVMHARDLAEAIEFQNATDYGLTAGIHSLDPDEVNAWIDTVQAGNLYVNRGITGAIVQRQPFGGWKRSSVGTTGKAGGPNYLTHFGSWTPKPLRAVKSDVPLSTSVQKVLHTAESSLTPADRAALAKAAASDQIAWSREFGVAKDVSGLQVERNVFRYRTVPVTVRFGEEGRLADLVRVLIAAKRVGAKVTVSSHQALAAVPGVDRVETEAEWLAYANEHRPARVRLIGSDPSALADAVGGNPDVAIYGGPVTPSGRLEALPFLREQSVTITTHRFGNHDTAFDQVLPRQ
ncbi:MAG: bifunctional proline dehydrogenase/L-glutamate gamma-semialdehyde dehydrogenase [Actinomycetota bacterium]|nr:bifunctional proline dehydrogenase/L-glutamate gamma-semialdehyde dehydrogenase [Actinomycetota bacterium]